MSHRRLRADDRPAEQPDEALDAFVAWAALNLAEPVRRPRVMPVEPSAPKPETRPPDTRGPSPQRIQRPRIRARDIAVLHQLARTGVAAERQLVEGAGLSHHRLGRLVDAGFLRRDDRLVAGRLVRIYTLGPIGIRRLRRDDFGLRYKRNPNQLAHDLKLTDMYYALPPMVRATWRHEGELMAAMKAAGTYAGACVDAAVEIDGWWVAIEALSAHYSKAQIAAKEAVIAEHFGGRGLMI